MWDDEQEEFSALFVTNSIRIKGEGEKEKYTHKHRIR